MRILTLETYRQYNKEIVNETFFNKVGDDLSNLVQSIKNIIINCMYAEKNDYKIDYFVNDYKQTIDKYFSYLLLNFKNKTKERFIEEFNLLLDNIDNDVLETLGVLSLYENIKEIFSYDVDQIINKIEKIKKVEFDKNALIKIINSKIEKSLPIINNIDTEILKNEYNVEKYKEMLYFLKIELLKLQEYVKDNKKKVLIIFDGRDAAGKGSCTNMISSNLDPKYFRVETFGIPNEHEKKHWFKRYTEKLPNDGEIVAYDRSWYNRGYLEPALDYCTTKQYNEFMSEVNDYEKGLLKKGIILIKVWLSVDKNVQILRFELRKSDPLKYWKYSKNDEKTIKKWEEMSLYINTLLKSTNKYSSWNIINSNDKYKAEIVSISTILKNINYTDKNTALIKESVDNRDSYIFLDVDGVIIPFADGVVDHKKFNETDKWSKDAIKYLNELVEKTGAKIIISSTYRKHKTLKEIEEKFKEAGFKYYLHEKKLPGYERFDRGKNIEEFITIHKPKSYVVIDDNTHDFEKFPNIHSHWIQPNTKIGIDNEDFNKSLEILSK